MERRHFLEMAAAGSSALILPSCITYITEPRDEEEEKDGGGDGNEPTGYSNISGAWRVSGKDDFGNSGFKGSFSIDNLNLTQTNQLKEGYTRDVYKLRGNFSGFSLSFQRKSDGALYIAHQNVSGDISKGGINVNISSHNLEFYLGSSEDYRLRGVTQDYESMRGDLRILIDMTKFYGTSDGIITLTGSWDAKRK